MLHRMVSRSAGVLGYAALALVVASCEDNTTGTPNTPPPASTAVYVNAIIPEGGYGLGEETITIEGVDTTVTVVVPDPEFEVVYPDGSAAVGQTIQFSLNLPGLLESTTGVVGADGRVTPGRWIVSLPCTAETDYCRPVQRVIASPASGNIGTIDVSTEPPPPPEPEEPALRTR